MIEKKNQLSHQRHLQTFTVGKESTDDVILAVHGWLDNVGSYLPLVHTAPQSLSWHLINLLGHGHSDWKEPGSFYYFHDYVNDLIEYIERLEVKRIHLVGHSLGASIVSILAGLLPDKICSCILLDCLGPLVSNESLIAEQWRLSLKQYRKEKPRRYYPSLEALIEARQRKHQIKLSSCKILVDYGHHQDGKTGQYYWSFDPRLLNLSPLQMTQEQSLAILKHIACPTLLINAKEGYPLEGPEFEERKACIETLEEKNVTGFHHVHMDNPALIWEYMDLFYKKNNVFQ